MRGFDSVNGRGADDCGQKTGRLQAVGRKSAASLLRRSPRPSALKATSRKPKAPARPTARPGFCGLAGRFLGLFHNRPKAWFLPPSNPLKPRQRAHAWPRFRCKNRSKKSPPKNASIARFQGFCCYRIRSEIRAVSGAWVRQLNGRGADGCGQKTGRLQVVCRKTAAARPSSIRAASRKPRPAHNHTDRAFAAWPGVSRAFPATGPGLGFCSCNPLKPRQRTRAWPRFHYKNRSKKRPPENASIARFQRLCCYQSRSEIKAVFGAWVQQCERAHRGRLRTGHGPLASGLLKKRRQPAAARPASIRAASRKPQAASRKPKAKSQKPKAKSQKPKAESHKPKAESRKPKAEIQKPRPAQPHGPGFRGLTGAFPGPFPQQAQGLVSAPLKPAQIPPAGACMAPAPLRKQERKKPP